MRLEELLASCPNVSITLQAADLVELGERLISDAFARAKEERNGDPELLSVEEAKKLFGVSENTLWRWRKRGYLEGVPVGGRIKYLRSDCERIIRARDGE